MIKASAPLYVAERLLNEKVRKEIEETLITRQIAEQAADRARKIAANAKPEEREEATKEAISAAKTAASICVPTPPRLIADDVTNEAAASLLAENGGRLAIISAEGGVFDIMAGRYTGGVASLDVWLKGHSGDTLRVDRKGRAAEHVERPALTIAITAQPEVLSSIARNQQFRGRGLLARFLYSVPESNIGRRIIGAPHVPEDVENTYVEKLSELAVEMHEWKDEPAVITLSPAANELLLDTERRIEKQLAPGGKLSAIAGWGGKLAGATVRLAGLLHLAEHGPNGYRFPVDEQTMTNAVKIAEYFSDHAQRAFDLLGDDAENADAAYVLDHIQRRELIEFSSRQLLTDLPRGRFAKVGDVTAALAMLEEHGYIHAVKMPEPQGPGRPPSPRFHVHAAVSAQYAEPPSDQHYADCADCAATLPNRRREGTQG